MHLKSYVRTQMANVSLVSDNSAMGESIETVLMPLNNAVSADICPMGKRFYFSTCILLGYYEIKKETSLGISNLVNT